MIDWLAEPFSVRFMQQALLGGLLAAVTTALIGTWVVIRGMAFMGDALAHGVLPGIGLAFVGMLALGVIIVSRLPSFTTSLTTFLFGDILGIRASDLAVQAVAAALTIVGAVLAYRPFLVLS